MREALCGLFLVGLSWCVLTNPRVGCRVVGLGVRVRVRGWCSVVRLRMGNHGIAVDHQPSGWAERAERLLNACHALVGVVDPFMG